MELRSQPPQATVLQKYCPILKLGQGGMADVYLAVSRSEPGFERLAVIKRIRTELLRPDGDELEDVGHIARMFWDEARLSMLLKHANIAHGYEAASEADTLYLVMEYIEGQSLSAVSRYLSRRGRQLSPLHAAVVVSSLLAGLHYAHEVTDISGKKLNIVHRDVSPENVLIGYDGSVKLVDFGVAKTEMQAEETRAGMMKGKACYMAPEQVMNGSVDRRADVYAAGVVLWELVAGRKLVAGSNVLEQLMSVMKAPTPRLSTLVPDVDPQLERIVHKALERESADRYATALEMREALEAFIASHGGTSTEEVGALVSDLFSREREKMQRQIRERLVAAVSETGEGAPEIFARLDAERRPGRVSQPPASLEREPGARPRNSPSLEPASTSSVSISPGQGSLTTTSGVAQSADAAPASPARKLFPVLYGSLAILLVTVGTLLGVVASSSKAGEASASPPPRPQAAAAAAPAPPKDSEVPPMPVARIEAKKSSETAVDVRSPKVVTAPTPRPAAVPVVAPWPASRQAQAKQPEPPPSEETTTNAEPPGYFTIDTYPWTQVRIDGRVVGNTPIVGLALPPGPHTVVLENSDDNIRQTTTINVKSGERTSKRLAF